MAPNYRGEELSTFRPLLVTFLDRECDITVMTIGLKDYDKRTIF